MWKKFMIIAATIAILMQGGYILNKEMAKPAVVELSRTLDIVNGKTAYMTLDGIGAGTYDDVRENMMYIKALGIKDVHLTMNNGGGKILHMWAIYDMLYQATMSGSINLTTHAQGLIASAAVPIYLLGDRRIVDSSAFVMIHCHSGTFNDYQAETEQDMLETWTQRWIDVMEDRTLMSRANLLIHMATGLSQKKDAFFMNAQTALDYGFATEIN